MCLSGRELDLLGARAWPPLEEIRIDEWRVRFAGGVTKRANSVLPLGSHDVVKPEGASEEATLASRIAAVESSYAERGLLPRFQLTASSWPPELADALVARGYVESDRTLVMTSSLTEAASAFEYVDVQIVEAPKASIDWVDTWWTVERRGGAEERRVARAILDHIKLPCLFVACHDGEGLAAVALGVLDGKWIGLYCASTLPRARRRGYARTLTRYLIERAQAMGATHAHLAVAEANEQSKRLCRAAGFSVRQQYSYFTLTASEWNSSRPRTQG